MNIRVKVLNGGEGYESDIEYLEYHLQGRPGGNQVDSDLKPLEIFKFNVETYEPLIVEIDCEECNIDEYLGGFDDIEIL